MKKGLSRLSSKYFTTDYETEEDKLNNKIKELNSKFDFYRVFEVDLGISLEILEKAINEGFYYIKHGKLEYVDGIKNQKDLLIFDIANKQIILCYDSLDNSKRFEFKLRFEDYLETWFLWENKLK